jgi:hypothetical protein
MGQTFPPGWKFGSETGDKLLDEIIGPMFVNDDKGQNNADVAIRHGKIVILYIYP